MKLHTKYQRPGPSGFRQEDLFLSFQLKKSMFSSCDLDVQWTETICTILKSDQPRTIPVKFGQNQWFRRRFEEIVYGRTHGRTTDKM